MQSILYWSPVVPQLLPLLSQELKKPGVDLTLQVHPAEKTILFNEARADEMLRCDSIDVASMKRWLNNNNKREKLVIVDLWGLIFRKEFDGFISDFVKLLPYANQTIVVAPKNWTSVYRLHPMYAQADAHTKSVFDKLFARLRAAFEALWNSRSNARLVSTPTPFSLLESLSGRVGVAPHKFLGLHFLPSDCRKWKARFASSSIIAKEALARLEGGSSDKTTWQTNLRSEVSYFKGLSASGKNADAGSLAPPFCLPTSWTRFLQGSRLAENVSIHEILRGEYGLDKAARWLYLIAALENDMAEIEKNTHSTAALLFGENATHSS